MSTILGQTQQTVQQLLSEKFPHAENFGDGSFAIAHGSTSVAVIVRAYTETDTMVEIMAQVVSGAKVEADTMHWLLRKNAELHFGSFGLLFDDTIVFTYSLPGGSINANDLEAAITSVAVIADHYDNELVAMAGGKTFNEE
jgi:hypothetical protein